MSLKNFYVLLLSVITINNVYTLDYYMNNIENQQNNNHFMQYNYIDTQNEAIHNKIAEKLEHARQQLSSMPDDNELSDYIKKLEDLQNIDNISQEVEIDTLIDLQLIDINNNEYQHNINLNNNNPNPNHIDIDNNNDEQHNIEQNNNIIHLNNDSDNINMFQNNPGIAIIQINNLANFFGNLNNMFDNDDNELDGAQFTEWYNKITNSKSIAIKDKSIREFCNRILGNNFNNLDDVFRIADRNTLETIKNTIKLEAFSDYMKYIYMDIEGTLTTLVNTFIEQCQEGLYGDCENKNDFYKLFDDFFNNSKENQYIEKINNLNNTIMVNKIYYSSNENYDLIHEILNLLTDGVKLVETHIDNEFEKLMSQKMNYYNKVLKKDPNILVKFEPHKQIFVRDTNYSLKQLMHQIYNDFYPTNSSDPVIDSCKKLKIYLCNNYNDTYFKIHILEDISSLKFKLNKNFLLNNDEQKLQNILNNAQDEKLNTTDYNILLNKYTIKISDSLKKELDNAHKAFFYNCRHYTDLLKNEVKILQNTNQLNTVKNQLKLDLFDKLKEQNFFVNKIDAYMLTVKLYPIIK